VVVAAANCEPWPVDLSCCGGLPDNVPDSLIDRWAAVASTILWGLSGRRWGPSCPTEVRPCRRSCVDQTGLHTNWGAVGGRWVPYIRDGRWYNASVCGCGTTCSCTELCEVWLEAPVYDIVSVTVDTETLEESAYRVDYTDRGTMLVRTDGGCWPDCQDMTAPCGAEGTFCVVLRTGLALDEAAIAAVSELTCEFVKACPELAGADCHCRLPGNVQRVVRQGVVVEMADPTTIFDQGRTNLPLVDLWLSTVNPNRLPYAPRVYSTNLRRPRVTRILPPDTGESS
jgi:hypothetical protein